MTQPDTSISKPIPYGRQQRLIFIRKLLAAKGSINRKDITAKFGISLQQASHDLQIVMEKNPNLMTYDESAKCYIATVTAQDDPLQAKREEIHKSLCANHLTSDVAWFLACLAVDVEQLKELSGL